ncbi:MAG: hypothetical protein GX664_07805 [Bacteroidales bacterium]|jgi:hypothetical protein|nr:hypothetical protein [Bacteroidales bacterium]
MKRFAIFALSLILVMGVCPGEALGQSRRSSANNTESSVNSTKSNNSANVKSGSRKSSNVGASKNTRTSAAKTTASKTEPRKEITAPKSNNNRNAAVKAPTPKNNSNRNAAVKAPARNAGPVGKEVRPPRNEPPRGDMRPPRNEPPRHNMRPPRPPRPTIGSRIRANMLHRALTLARINRINDAVRRSENAAYLARRYSIVVNTNYVPRTYAEISARIDDRTDYYYDDGVFYVLDRDGDYYVIEPPIGALVESLPRDYERVYLNDELYYQVENTLYKLSVVNGIPYFEVICNL